MAPPTRLKNRNVIYRFVGDGPDVGDLNGHGNVKTHNGKLYSYRACIAEWRGSTRENAVLVVHAGWDGYSTTTSTHMKHLYDAVTGNAGSHAYRRDDYDSQTGYENAEAGVPLVVTTEGKGTMKPRWKRLETAERAEDGGGGD